MKKIKRKHQTVSNKLNAVTKYLTNEATIADLAREYEVEYPTILKWVNERNDILVKCKDSVKLYSQTIGDSKALMEVEYMAKKIIDSDDLIKENLKLKKEHEWDKNKIAYLESMLELYGIDPDTPSKKKEKK
jgi:transposase-like protein